MTFKDYISEVRADGLAWIEEVYENYLNFDDLYDDMWVEDSITGNGSGSYTFNGFKARKNVEELVWDDDFLFELQMLDMCLADLMEQGAEAVDVSARCLALSHSYDEFENRYNELKEDERENEDVD